MVVLDHRSAQAFTASIRQLQQDIHAEWHTDAYECWRVDRPAGWADSKAVEAQELIEAGTGRLYANGPGGPQGGEMVISIESPYRLRTLSDSLIDSGHLLVIGNRRFRVDIAKRRGDEPLMDAYLSELFSTPLPGSAP